MARTNWAAFISYSKRDRAIARRLHAALETAGLRSWMDASNLQAGERLTQNVEAAIADASCVVVLLTPFANESKWVQKEVELACALDKPVFLVSVRNIAPAEWFPESIRDQVRIDAGASLTQASRREIIQRVYHTDRGGIPVISILNMKGGVGKTTLAYHLFGCLHDHRKVSMLLVDLDPQHNLSQLMVPTTRMEAAWGSGRSVLSAFEPVQAEGFAKDRDLATINPDGKVPSPEQIAIPLRPASKRPLRLDIALGHFEIVKLSLRATPAERDKLVQNFKTFIEQARRSYGIVVIDLNPGASFLTEAALSVSTHIVAPVRPDRYSKRGLELLDRLMEGAFRITNSPERIAIVNGRQRSGSQAVLRDERAVIDDIRSRGNWRTLEAEIGESDVLKARPRAARADEDLTHFMAHKTWHNSRSIRAELMAAADEIAVELGV